MSATTTTDATDRADAYLAEVRRHLADLTDDERDDLLDDLTAHVHEVAARAAAPLAEALGTPEAFAAELLAAAGLAPSGQAGRGPIRHTAERVTTWSAAIRAHPWTRAVVAFLPELRPAWWVARAWLLVYGLWVVVAGPRDSFPVPELLGSSLLGVAGIVAASVASVRLGGRSPAPAYRVVVDVLAVGAALVLLVAVDDVARGGYDDPYYQDVMPSYGSLVHADGSPITNIHAYDAAGEPLEQVRLFDQHGRPIEIQDPTTEWGDPLLNDIVVDTEGLPATNVYPLDQYAVTWDDIRQAETRTPIPDPVLQVAPLLPTSSTTTATMSPPTSTDPGTTDPGTTDPTGAPLLDGPAPPPGS